MNFPRELPSSYSSAAVTPSSVTKTSHGDVNSLLHHSLQRQIILYSSYFVFCKKEETINYSLADRLTECESNGNDCWLAGCSRIQPLHLLFTIASGYFYAAHSRYFLLFVRVSNRTWK